MLSQIFLDLDGVLADFVGPACDALGVDVATWPPGVYDLEAVTKSTTEEVWRAIDARGVYFWSQLPLLDGARALVAQARALAGEQVFVLSGPSRSAESYAGKRLWMDQHFPDLPLLLAPAQHKRLLADPKRLLIDDSGRNIDEWIVHRGQGILFPQPWNRCHARASVGLSDVLIRLEHLWTHGGEIAARPAPTSCAKG